MLARLWVSCCDEKGVVGLGGDERYGGGDMNEGMDGDWELGFGG